MDTQGYNTTIINKYQNHHGKYLNKNTVRDDTVLMTLIYSKVMLQR